MHQCFFSPRLHRFRKLPLLAAAVLAGVVSTTTAQTAPTDYLGLNIGRADYDDFSCGNGQFGCDDSATRVHLYAGRRFNDWFGVEAGYLNEGKVDRGGGSTRASGLNFSLVARAPIGAFHVFAKGGATYGRTRVSSDALSGLDDGRGRGWGPSFGAGVGYDFTPNAGLVLEWSRHAFRVPGGGRRDVDGASIGYVHRF